MPALKQEIVGSDFPLTERAQQISRAKTFWGLLEELEGLEARKLFVPRIYFLLYQLFVFFNPVPILLRSPR